MADIIRDEDQRRRVRLAQEFLDPDDVTKRSYRADILVMLNRKLRRLTVRPQLMLSLGAN
jgi:DNA replication licensing factor MCM3